MNKKKIKKLLVINGLLYVLPLVTLAQFNQPGGAETSGLANLVRNIVNFTNGILLPAVLAIAFFVFVWGIFKFFILGGANDEAKEQGKSLMIYATLGFVFIVIFWGLVNFLSTTIGLEDDSITRVKLFDPGFGGVTDVGTAPAP